ncbi:collagen alpha-2(I) chain-like [Mastomys coucha]|uniref:collagen alpha-2(I) chain-like n=1 Tax=Mastomys coucha TaxID=35658 RepID=UPI0012628413|nr:collagen alpha-2(I) chain-like [Mastomys coucha]
MGSGQAPFWARQNGALAGPCPDVRCLRLRPVPVLHPSGSVVEGGLRLVFLKVGFGEGQPAVTPAVGRESGLPGRLFPGARGVGRPGIGPGIRRASGSAAGARQAGVEDQAGRAVDSPRGGRPASAPVGVSMVTVNKPQLPQLQLPRPPAGLAGAWARRAWGSDCERRGPRSEPGRAGPRSRGPRGCGLGSGGRGLKPGVGSTGPGSEARTPAPAQLARSRGGGGLGRALGAEAGALLAHRGRRSFARRSVLRAGPGASCSFVRGERALTWPEAPRVSQDWAGRLRPPPTPGPARGDRPASSSWRPGSAERRSACVPDPGGGVFAFGGAESLLRLRTKRRCTWTFPGALCVFKASGGVWVRKPRSLLKK